MRESGRLDEALAYFKSALISKKAKVGNDHEDVADAMHNMAIILDDLEKYDLSITCYQEVSFGCLINLFQCTFDYQHCDLILWKFVGTAYTRIGLWS